MWKPGDVRILAYSRLTTTAFNSLQIYITQATLAQRHQISFALIDDDIKTNDEWMKIRLKARLVASVDPVMKTRQVVQNRPTVNSSLAESSLVTNQRTYFKITMLDLEERHFIRVRYNIKQRLKPTPSCSFFIFLYIEM